MFGKTQLQSVCRSLIVPAFLFGVWGFGIGAMMLGSAYAPQSNGANAKPTHHRLPNQPSTMVNDRPQRDSGQQCDEPAKSAATRTEIRGPAGAGPR